MTSTGSGRIPARAQWLLVEATEAYSVPGRRIVEDLEVVETYPDAMAAMMGYRQHHRREPERELYPLHTDREVIEITESWGPGFKVAL